MGKDNKESIRVISENPTRNMKMVVVGEGKATRTRHVKINPGAPAQPRTRKPMSEREVSSYHGYDPRAAYHKEEAGE